MQRPERIKGCRLSVVVVTSGVEDIGVGQVLALCVRQAANRRLGRLGSRHQRDMQGLELIGDFHIGLAIGRQKRPLLELRGSGLAIDNGLESHEIVAPRAGNDGGGVCAIARKHRHRKGNGR